ncbi:hypothetical protein ACFL08_02050 [Patescibacteria group bacterium]
MKEPTFPVTSSREGDPAAEALRTELGREKYQYNSEKGLEGTPKMIFDTAEKQLEMKVAALYEGKMKHERDNAKKELATFLKELKKDEKMMSAIVGDLNAALVADTDQGTYEGEDKIGKKFSENLADGLFTQFTGKEQIDH